VRIFVFEHMEAAASDEAIEKALAIAANIHISGERRPVCGGPRASR
jgi:hypothetical protein